MARVGTLHGGGIGAVRGLRHQVEQLQRENERLKQFNERLCRELAATRAACAGYVAAQVAAVASGRPMRDEVGARRLTRALDGGGLV